VDITNVKSGAMSRTGGSGTGGSAQPEEVHDWRKCTTGGSARAEGVYERRECAGGGGAE